MMTPIDWESLDDDQLLVEAEALIDQGRLHPRVLALIEAIILAGPGPPEPPDAERS